MSSVWPVVTGDVEQSVTAEWSFHLALKPSQRKMFLMMLNIHDLITSFGKCWLWFYQFWQANHKQMLDSDSCSRESQICIWIHSPWVMWGRPRLLKNPRVLWVVESNFLKLCETNLWQILNHLSPFVNLAKVIPISLWHIMSGPAAQSSWITQHFIYFTWLKATYPYQCYYAYRYQHVVRIVFTIMECHFNQHWIHK